MNSLSLINCGFITVSAKERLTIAIREVLLDGKSIHQSASDNEIPYSTLRDNVKVTRLNESSGSGHPVDQSNEIDPETKRSHMTTLGAKYKTIFSSQQEKEMKEYIEDASHIAMGLTFEEVRSFAYKCGLYYGVNMPPSWYQNEKAGRKWLKLYQNRNRLSFRMPTATSMARLLAWNKEAVDQFMANLDKAYKKYNFVPSDIYVGDETGISTVAGRTRVLTAVGTKVMRTPEAAERGTLVTVMAAASAAGQTIPPMYIFPRKRHQDQWVTLGPVGSIGHATSSGWQDEKGFLKYLTHLQAITRCTKDCPILFIMDNFFAHLCPEVLIYAKDHGIILLTTPAHCTHRLMPLDLTVFKAFKAYIAKSATLFKKRPDKDRITIHDIPEISKEPWLNSFTPATITSGFNRAGIWPFQPSKFEMEFIEEYRQQRAARTVPYLRIPSQGSITV